MKPQVFSALIALAFASSAAYAAEDTYRSVMPDGSVRYGEAPDPGAKSFRKIPAPPATTGVIVVTPAEKSRGTAPVETGGVSVIQQPNRPAQETGAAQGRTQSPAGLPKGSGY